MNSTTTKMKKAIEQSCNLNIPDEETEISNNSILKNWLSNRTINVLSKNDIHTTRDLMDFVCEHSVWDLSGIGRSAAYELYNYLKNLAPECKFWLNGAEFPIKMVQKFWNNGTSFTDERCAFFIL